MIISRTPFRVSFFGGGTDYPAWYLQHGGAVLGTSIDKYCYLTCRYLPPFFEHRIRLVYSRMENCQTVAEISHPVVRSVLQYLAFDQGLEMHHDADLPARSGLGSSSAFTVGLLHALYGLRGQIRSKEQLAQESIFIEQTKMAETVGSQDQVLAAYGGLNHVVFGTDGSMTVHPLTLGQARIEELQSYLMLFYTGLQRFASQVAQSYVQDVESKERQMRLFSQMVTEAIALLSSGAPIDDFGRLLHDAWQAKRSLSGQVSNATIDDIYDAARAAGAIGGKILGAGGGGFMLFVVPPARQVAVRHALHQLVHVPFQFETGGSQIIYYDSRSSAL